MKTIALIIFSFLLTINGFASTREIVILTSIQNPKNNPFWRSKNYEISKDIELQYSRAFENSGYKIVFHHNADQVALEHYLQSVDTLALFWVSHATSEVGRGGVNFSSIIQDVSGNNVKNIFQKINPNMKFLSVVGCKAKSILDDFKNRGFYHSSLVLHSFDTKISLNNGIDQSLKAAAKIIDASPESFRDPLDILRDCGGTNCYRDALIKGEELDINADVDTNVEGLNIVIKNTNSKYSAELSVNNQFIGILKQDDKRQSFLIPKKLLTAKIKLKVSYDVELLKEQQSTTPLVVESLDQPVEVDFLKDINGNPYGGATNFYYIHPNE